MPADINPCGVPLHSCELLAFGGMSFATPCTRQYTGAVSFDGVRAHPCAVGAHRGHVGERNHGSDRHHPPWLAINHKGPPK